MSVHCMIDLETGGTGQDAAILSIGAVKFEATRRGEILDRFHVKVDLESCVAKGMKIEAGSFMWWLDPDRAEARAKILDGERVDIASTLEGFTMWFGMGNHTPIWSNGATFDIMIMRHAFKLCGLECPWKFWNERCFRTLKNLAPSRAAAASVAHDALDDAIAQAYVVQELNQQLQLNL